MNDLIFLTEDQIFGNNRLEIFQKRGTKASISDFSILLGGYVSDIFYAKNGNTQTLADRTGYYWTKTDDGDNDARVVAHDGHSYWNVVSNRGVGARPALSYSQIRDICSNRVREADGILEVEYGEYPQTAAPSNIQETLELLYQNNQLSKTGKIYTTDSRKYDDYNSGFLAKGHIEYEYNGKKYVRVEANSCFGQEKFTLSNGKKYKNGDYVWVEVNPIKWLIDEKKDLAISKDIIFAGVQFNKIRNYKGDFGKTDIKRFMDDCFSKEIVSNREYSIKTSIEENKKINPYGFSFSKVSEEDIIKGAIESNVPVFLHGKPGEGKSARIKDIDPDCEVLSLGTMSPELLIGMALKNSDENRVEYLPPPWYDRITKKAGSEPDKIHILFLDELNNASPNMQKYAFSIALDRKVNDRFPLPENVRIAAAGNEVEDSLAAYEIAEPLYDRFMHVNIHTTVEKWLEWASKHNIHPSVYAFISYGRDRVLRTEYDKSNPKPNADPRKWEMASKVLYRTKNPEMLRALVGEELTREFVSFCSKKVITIEDIIKDNYSQSDLEMDTAERWATVVALSAVDEKNVEKIRDFITKANFKPEFVDIFDNLWTAGDNRRLEKIAELRMNSNLTEGGLQR